MTHRELMIAECVKLAPSFKLSVEDVHKVGESIMWRATVGAEHHAGSMKLRPETRLADEERLLKGALVELTAIVKREVEKPAPEAVKPKAKDPDLAAYVKPKTE